mmetsp:Transcript_16193/g.20515  ORF Transcript_16193/g.20515 Transcript_16193/m.20515 type:complete len:139 (+) Transcript_16193:490-906(+)
MPGKYALRKQRRRLFRHKQVFHEQTVRPPIINHRKLHRANVKQDFQRHIQSTLKSSATPTTLPALNDAIQHAEEHVLAGNPEKDMLWFVLSKAILIPLCAACDTAQLCYHNKLTKTNRLKYREKELTLQKAVSTAKDL